MIDRVLQTIARFGMFSAGQRVGVAVSGGSDSVCLLHVLHELGPRWDLHLRVVHVDHGIRGAASGEDAEFVRALASSFALPFELRTADVPSIGDNLEQAARRVRQQFYGELLSGGAVDRIATGHTRSDQAETVLFRVLRGAASAGLAGIRPVTEEGIVRPLLYCTRDQVRSWLRTRGIAWREDETNQDCSFTRNRIRHELLPQLRREYNPKIDDALANLAEIARDEDDFLVGQLGSLGRPPGGAGNGPICLTLDQLGDHPAAARRLIRAAIRSIKGDLRQIDFGHVEAVLDMARAADGHGRIQVPGVDVFRSFDWVRFAPTGYDYGRERDFCVTVTPPQTVALPGGAGEIGFQVVEMEQNSAISTACDTLIDELDWQGIASLPAPAGLCQLELRNWRPGDHYRPVGERHERKIKLLFQEARIPLWERRSWPVVVAAGGQIVWSRKFGAAADFARNECSRTVLQIRDANQRLV